MTRGRAGDQLSLDLDAQPEVPETPAPAPRSPRGRPRKWGSDAERKRAYRERKAEELAEPHRLRMELRRERQRSGSLANEAERLRGELAEAADRLVEAEDKGERLEGLLGLAHGRTDHLRGELEQMRAELADERRLRRQAERAVEHVTHHAAEHGAQHAPAPRPLPPPAPQPARPCATEGCGRRASVRLQGPRGIERWACDVHVPIGPKGKSWKVVERLP